MLTHLSQSSLQDYVECPRRFQLRYLDRLSYPAEESEPALENERHIREGELFHRLAQQSLLNMPADGLARLANSPDVARWWQSWQDFCARAGLASLQVLLPEITLSAPLGQFRLLAKYDLIAGTPGGQFLIYDWKTYRKRPGNDWLASRLQTRIYRALLTKGGSHLNGGHTIQPGQLEMVYWFADFPSEPARFKSDEAALARDWAALLSLASDIASTSDFPLTDDVSRCSFCRYRSFCDRGVNAAMGEDVETELDWQDVSLEQIQEIEF